MAPIRNQLFWRAWAGKSTQPRRCLIHLDADGVGKENGMPRKLVLWLTAMAGGLLIAGQWPDIRRYAKIKMLSVGDGHPGNVPVAGRTSYPRRSQDANPDDAGDVESAGRGSPAS